MVNFLTSDGLNTTIDTGWIMHKLKVFWLYNQQFCFERALKLVLAINLQIFGQLAYTLTGNSDWFWILVMIFSIRLYFKQDILFHVSLKNRICDSLIDSFQVENLCRHKPYRPRGRPIDLWLHWFCHCLIVHAFSIMSIYFGSTILQTGTIVSSVGFYWHFLMVYRSNRTSVNWIHH